MAYDEDLATRLREAVATLTAGTDASVDEQKMFGGLAFLVNGNMAVAAGGGGGTMVRCDPGRGADLLAEEGVEPMQMGAGRVMSGWLLVAREAVESDERLMLWAGRGVGYALTLPPKSGRRRSRANAKQGTNRRPGAGAT